MTEYPQININIKIKRSDCAHVKYTVSKVIGIIIVISSTLVSVNFLELMKEAKANNTPKEIRNFPEKRKLLLILGINVDLKKKKVKTKNNPTK